MICCTVYKCKRRAGRPCCTYCDEKTCLDRCENHPDRCRVWRDPATQKAPRDSIDQEEVVRLATGGTPRAEIARRLGCSKRSVDHILQTRLGKLAPGARRRLDREEIFRLRDEGCSIKEIADALGCAASSIAYILRKEGGDGHG